jgi:hypothetical protein
MLSSVDFMIKVDALTWFGPKFVDFERLCFYGKGPEIVQWQNAIIQGWKRSSSAFRTRIDEFYSICEHERFSLKRLKL